MIDAFLVRKKRRVEPEKENEAPRVAPEPEEKMEEEKTQTVTPPEPEVSTKPKAFFPLFAKVKEQAERARRKRDEPPPPPLREEEEKPARFVIEIDDEDESLQDDDDDEYEEEPKPKKKKKPAPKKKKKKKPPPPKEEPKEDDEERKKRIEERRKELKRNEAKAFGGGASNPFFAPRRTKKQVPSRSPLSRESPPKGRSWTLPFAPRVPTVGVLFDEGTTSSPQLEPPREVMTKRFALNLVREEPTIVDPAATLLRNLKAGKLPIGADLWTDGCDLAGPSALDAANQLDAWLDRHWGSSSGGGVRKDDDESLEDDDDDFIVDDDDDDETPEKKTKTKRKRKTTTARAVLIVGAEGTGKTASARRAADRNGFHVLDVVAPTAAELKDLFAEATQSKRVHRRTLLLVEDADGRVDNDAAFQRALQKLVVESKCPVVATAKNFVEIGCGTVIDLKPLDAPHVEAVLLREVRRRLEVSPDDDPAWRNLCALVAGRNGGDVRQGLLQLQLDTTVLGRQGDGGTIDFLDRDTKTNLTLACSSSPSATTTIQILDVSPTTVSGQSQVTLRTTCPRVKTVFFDATIADILSQDNGTVVVRAPDLPTTFAEIFIVAVDGRTSHRNQEPICVVEYIQRTNRLRKIHSHDDDDDDDDDDAPHQLPEGPRRRRVVLDDDDDDDDDDDEAVAKQDASSPPNENQKLEEQEDHPPEVQEDQTEVPQAWKVIASSPPEEKSHRILEDHEETAIPPEVQEDQTPDAREASEKRKLEESVSAEDGILMVASAEARSAADVWRPRCVEEMVEDADEWEDPRVAAVPRKAKRARTELRLPQRHPPELGLYDAARELRAEVIRSRGALDTAVYDGVIAASSQSLAIDDLATDVAPCLRAICAAEAIRKTGPSYGIRRRRFNHHLGYVDATIAAFAPVVPPPSSAVLP